MTTASIWYQPFGTREVVEVQIPQFSRVGRDVPLIDEVQVDTIGGRRTRTRFSATFAVDYVCSDIDDYAVVRDLEGVQDHLRRGGLITLAENSARTLAGFIDGVPDPDSTTLSWLANLYGDYGSFTAVAGDILVLRGPGPEAMREEVQVLSSAVPTVVTLAQAPRKNWEGADWVCVRNKGFWPILRLRRGAADILVHDRRITTDLVLQLEEPPHALAALARHPGDALTPDDGTISIDQTVNELPGQAGSILNAPWSAGPPWEPVNGAPGRGRTFPW